MERSYQRGKSHGSWKCVRNSCGCQEPVGLAEEVDRPEENLHFKHQFQMLTHCLVP